MNMTQTEVKKFRLEPDRKKTRQLVLDDEKLSSLHEPTKVYSNPNWPISIEDTIVVSDRIRENFRGERGFEPDEIVNRSINQTLSRTLITSLTTLLVLFALFFFGGDMIRGFSQALIIGVLVGTYSSIYVVANMLLGLSITQDDLAIPEPEGAEFDDMP